MKEVTCREKASKRYAMSSADIPPCGMESLRYKRCRKAQSANDLTALFAFYALKLGVSDA